MNGYSPPPNFYFAPKGPGGTIAMNPGQNHHYSGSSLHMNGHPSHLKFQSAPKGPDWTTAMIPQCATNRGESYTSYVLTTISLAEPQHNEQRIPDEQRRRGLKSHPQNVQSRKVRSEAQMLSPSWRPSIRPSLCATGFCPAKSCFEPKSSQWTPLWSNARNLNQRTRTEA